MSRRTVNMTDALYEYVLSTSVREPEVLSRLREETATMKGGGMQISPDQGQFMGLLIEMLGARKALEVGVFTGYSSTIVALALPPDGRLVACDVSDEWTRVARRCWGEAGVAQKIELRLGPALDTLDTLVADGEAGTFDFAFVDADKENYLAYYERCLELVRVGGVVAFDNVLWGGSVADSGDQQASTVAIRQLNETLYRDDRISLSLVPIGDGLSLARKRA